MIANEASALCEHGLRCPGLEDALSSHYSICPAMGLLLKQLGNASTPSVAALTLSLMYYAFIRQYVREAVPLPRLIRDVPNSYVSTR